MQQKKNMSRADKYGFNIYTMTPVDLYIYKPHTLGKTKIADGLDFLLTPCNSK
jgi:hypothetical protein